MIYRQFVRDGQIAETRRQELLQDVAKQFAIREAREPKPSGQRPFAAPGSFLVFLKRHLASNRFRPATMRPGGSIG